MKREKRGIIMKGDKNAVLLQLSITLALIFTALALSSAFVLSANILFARQIDLDESAEFSRFAELAASGDEEAVEKARLFDTLSRRAYFISQKSKRVSLIALLISLALALTFIRSSIHFKKELVPKASYHDGAPQAFRSFVYSASFAGLLALLSAAVFFVYPIIQSATDEKAQYSQPASREGMYSNWAAFRGAFSSASVHTDIEYPQSFEGKELWKTQAPKGFSSPIIWKDSVIFTYADEKEKKLVVRALDINSGSEQWSFVHKSEKVFPEVTPDTGHSAPSPASDGVFVYALFSTGELIAVDMEGGLAWTRELATPENHYGHSSSLIAYEGKLYVQYDHLEEQSLKVIDCASSQTVFETLRECDISWASPVLFFMDDSPFIALSANPIAAVYNADNAALVWEAEGVSGEIGPSPAYSEGRLFFANEYSRLVALSAEDGSLLWEANESLPEVSSPLAVDGRLYTASAYSEFCVYDAAGGERLLRRSYDEAEGFYSSPVYADGKVYLIGRGGEVYIFDESKDARLLSRYSLGERVDATPAFSKGKIVIRTYKSIICFGEE